MEVPQTLKIGGHVYTIVINNTCRTDEGQACCGKHMGAQETIEINPCYPVGTQEATLLHEIIEAINWAYELGMEHRQISGLEEGLYQVLKDNRLQFSD